MGTAEGRQLHLEGYLAVAGAEPREQPGAPTCTPNTERGEFDATQRGDAKDLLERICARENMREAYRRVVRNKGAGGVDGMQVAELDAWLEANYDALIGRLLAGKYKPKPVRRVEIPKEEKGKTRQLGIPTVVDRMVQQAIVQQLTPIYEPKFSEHSFGFRPNRSAHDALLAAKAKADAGDIWVASIDLERFFDTVNQSKLVQLLSDSIPDGRVVSLVHRFLQAGVMVDGVVMPTEEGTPQGGPLSPLLANVMLDELDKELEALEALSAAQKEKAAQPAKTGVPPVLPEVSIDDFAKCDFRVCRILACEKVANSDKLLRFTLDDGSGAERQILSGMAPYYPEPQALVGKKVVAILNLPARKMAGLESNGMLLSAERDGKVYLTILDDAVPAGAQIS